MEIIHWYLLLISFFYNLSYTSHLVHCFYSIIFKQVNSYHPSLNFLSIHTYQNNYNLNTYILKQIIPFSIHIITNFSTIHDSLQEPFQYLLLFYKKIYHIYFPTFTDSSQSSINTILFLTTFNWYPN